LLAFSFKNNRNLTPPDDEALKAHLDALLLTDIGLETDASTLSVGQLQRICLIRGLLLNPKVLLLDEPASALDEQSAWIVQETTLHLCTTKGLTVLMVSHHRFEPSQAKVHLLQIDNGRVEEG
jgi:putative ABC transport system ATP-binding protein